MCIRDRRDTAPRIYRCTFSPYSSRISAPYGKSEPTATWPLQHSRRAVSYTHLDVYKRQDGAPRYAMIATVLGAVLNLILDPVAIFVFHLGVRGAAIATVIGQVVSCLMTALYFRRPKSFRLQRSSFRINGRLSKKIAQLGISSFITQVAIVVIIGVSNNMICLLYTSRCV